MIQESPWINASLCKKLGERLRRVKFGQSNKVSGALELIVLGLPHIVVFTCDDTAVSIIGVFHGARDRG